MERSHHWFSVVAISTFVCLTATLYSDRIARGQANFESPPIDYLNAPVNDPVAKLAERVAQGEIELKFDKANGYLRSLLVALDVPESSQMLVFSKTSLQLQRISPRRPRALYFNDDVYVGWCQRGDVLELAATDPQQGAIFYTLQQTETEHPKFVRDQGQCLTCHASSRTQNVPGYLVRSVYADAAGQPILGSGTYTSDHTSPFNQRWGGWYVTGRHGEMFHMGNKLFRDDNPRDDDLSSGANLTTLEGLVAVEPYLTPHSDLIALMVVEHQTQMHNALVVANYETRMALHQSNEMNKLLDRPEDFVSESAERRIAAAAQRVLEHLLMSDEFQLAQPVSGTSNFASDFQAKAIRDSRGRSLRDLDLANRLFRYPCSYLIYNPAFTSLPSPVRNRILSDLRDILTATNEADIPTQYRHLTAEKRTSIHEILLATHPQYKPLFNP